MKRADELMRAMFEETQAPGLACVLSEGGRISHFSSYGVSDLEYQSPFRVDHLFPIGSLTKSFGAAAILILREEGLLSLDQSPREFIAELDHTWDGVSLFQLLSMQSGLGDDTGGSWTEQHLLLSNADLTQRFALPRICAARPGAQYLYSSFGYMVLGRVISCVAGQDARDFILQRLLIPLGMNSTSWSVPLVNAATGYRLVDSQFKREAQLSSFNDGAVCAGLWSSFSDLVCWIDFLSCMNDDNEGRYAKVLTQSARLEMQRAVALRPIVPAGTLSQLPLLGYGLGLARYSSRYEWIVGHGGAVPGFGCQMCWSPHTGIGVVAVANIRYADLAAGCEKIITLAREIVPARETPPRPLIAARASDLLGLVREWDSAVAERLFAFNFFIDYPREDIMRRFSRLGSRYAKHLNDARIIQLNGLSAKIVIGEEELMNFTVSSLEPGEVQELILSGA